MVEFAHSVIQRRVGFGELVALALLGDHVEELWSLEFANVLQCRDQCIQIVSVDRPDIVEAEFLEQCAARCHQALHVLFDASRQGAAEYLFASPAGGVIGIAGEGAGENLGECPNWRRDRHLVVVEDHQQIHIRHAGVVQGFESHPCGHRTIADHRNRMLLAATHLGGYRHSQRCGNRGGGVCRAKRIVRAFTAPRKTRDAVILAQRGHGFTATCENLVAVGLMAYIPDQAIVWRVEHVVQCKGQFHRAEIRRQMPAGAGDRLNEEAPQFSRQIRQLLALKFAQILR